MERPERHIDLFDYLNKAGPIKEPVVRDVFIQVRKKYTYTTSRNMIHHVTWSMSSLGLPLSHWAMWLPVLDRDIIKVKVLSSGS